MKNVKKMICLVIALLATVSLCACGAEEAPTLIPTINSGVEMTVPSAPVLQDDPTVYEEPTIYEEPTVPEEPAGEKYESATMEVFGVTDTLKDNFAQVQGWSADYYLGEDGLLYDTEDGWEPYSQYGAVETFYVNGVMGYKTADGYIHIGEYLISDITGEIVYAFDNAFGGEMIVISKDDEGYLYINGFEKSGLKVDYLDNTKFYIDDLDSDTYYDRVDSIALIQDGWTNSCYVEVDGKRFFGNFTGVMMIRVKPQIMLSPMDEKVEKVFDFGHRDGVNSPIYSVKGVDDKLFFLNGKYDELSVTLPEGYKVADLADVVMSDTLVLQFADGSVYVGEMTYTIQSPEFTKNEELSAYGAEGKLRGIFMDTYNHLQESSIVVLMDDNVLYKVI